MLKANNIRAFDWIFSVHDEDASSSKVAIHMNKICQQRAKLDDVSIWSKQGSMHE